MSNKQLFDYIERLCNWLRNEMRREGSELGLQPVHLEALYYLSICNRYSDIPMGVTEYLGQTKGTVSQTLKVLEKKGLITRQPDKRDKRLAHLKVSKAGQTLLEKSFPPPNFMQACAQVSGDSNTAALNVLKSLLTALQGTNKMKAFGVCKTCAHNVRQKDGSYFCNLTKESLDHGDVEQICREYE